MTTSPGTSWTLRSAGSTLISWQSVAWSGPLGRYVAVGQPVGGAAGLVIYSADGINWSSVSAPTNAAGSQMNWQRVVWSDTAGLFVAVGVPVTSSSDLGRVMTSPDGTTWTIQTTSVTSGQIIQWNNVVYAPGLALWIAVGQDLTPSGLTNLAMTSPDAITWTMHSAPAGAPADIQWNGLAWSPVLSLLAATGFSPGSLSGPHIMTSPDGLTWTGRTSPADSAGNFIEVAWSDALALFATTSSVLSTTPVMTSSDGITWTSKTVSPSTQWYPLLWIPVFGFFLGIGLDGTGGDRELTSVAGTTWNVGSITGFSPATQTWRGLAYSPDLFRLVAVATAASGSGAIMSSDGSFTPTQQFILGASPAGGSGYCDISDATLAAGQVLTDDSMVKISENAKFAAVRPEVIFMGYYANGATVPVPQSLVDGYVYSRSEIIFE